jgi:C4-dicarboxylate transporter
MTLNEILLILAVIVVLTVPYFLLKRTKQPLTTYIKLAAGLFLLILVWFFAPSESKIAIKVLMSTIVVTSAIKTIKEYLDYSKNSKIGHS